MSDPVPDVASPAVTHCGRVAVVGRPSVGKSTLVNAMVGAHISITSNKPQTTRQRLLGVAQRGSAQVVFVDTPGWQTRHRTALNLRMNSTVHAALADAEAVLFVLAAPRLTDADRAVFHLIDRALPVIAAVNKIDEVARKDELLPLIAEVAKLADFRAIVPVSAERGVQVGMLADELAALMPPGEPMFGPDEITDRNERFLAGEFVREKIFRLAGDEIPYTTTAVVERFAIEGALRRIHVVVYVDKASHRAILLGHGGLRMKRIATEARREIERLIDAPVHLEVWVRVRRGWSRDDASLSRLGIE